jgi:hypothetical protein
MEEASIVLIDSMVEMKKGETITVEDAPEH